MWSGEAAYLIGGGPSLRGFNWKFLESRAARTLVVNRALVDAPWADLFFTEDLRFVEKYAGGGAWNEFRGRKVFHLLDENFRARVLELDSSMEIIPKRTDGKRWGRSLGDGLSYASTSAVGALNLLDVLGCDPIYLLGIDCRALGNTTGNYHDDYPDLWKVGRVQADTWRNEFDGWASIHLKHKRVVNIINPAFESTLTKFEKVEMGRHFGYSKAASDQGRGLLHQ